MPAVAYLRRSRVDTRRDGAMSHEQQLSAVRGLAQAHGDDPDALVIVEDWGKSGRAEKQHLRTGFARLEAMVAGGEATAIYAYSANRLARSLEALARLAKLCEANGVPIRCADGYSPDVTTSTGRMVLGILGSVYAWQAEWTQERAQEVTAVRRGRGDHMGPAPYGFRVVDGQLVDRPGEDFDLVIAAYREEGSFQGAARRLTADGVPTRKGKFWLGSTVWGILAKRAPEELPPAGSAHRRRPASFRLSGLLQCPHDGAMLTGQTYRGQWVAYACRKAAEDPHHPRPRSIAESKVLPWVVDEVSRLRVPDQVSGDLEAENRRPALEARRDRVTDAFLDGTIDKVRRDQELLAIADELEALSDRATVIDVPTIDWSWPPDRMGPVLRAILDHVELGPDLVPVSAVWRVPEWRS
jgi:DNA invertase Pin-like site-specific DNA recombinase